MVMPRIIFAGTPDFAAIHLESLITNGIRPIAIYTQPDRPKGRGHALTPSPCKQIAEREGIKVYTPINFKNDEDIKEFKSLAADLMIVVAYGLILPHSILESLTIGAINVHASLLPAYRGAAPIQRALLDGLSKTGITIMKIADELDAGDIYTTASLDILPTDTSESLFNRLANLGSNTLVNVLPSIIDGSLTSTPQEKDKVTYAKKITKDESLLNFNKDAYTLEREIRGLFPCPVATICLNKITYKVFSATVLESTENKPCGTILGSDKDGLLIQCENSVLRIESIQAPGKGRVKASDFCRSKKDIFEKGKVLSF